MPIRIVQFTTVSPTLALSSTRSTMASLTHPVQPTTITPPQLLEMATRTRIRGRSILCLPHPILLRTLPILPVRPLLLQCAQSQAEYRRWSRPIHTTDLTVLVSVPAGWDTRSEHCICVVWTPDL